MSLASAYSFAAETAVLVAGPTIILAPIECNCFIASRESSALDFEFAITRSNFDVEFILSKYLFTSFSAFSRAIFIGFPMDEEEPVIGIIAPTRNSSLGLLICPIADTN